MALFKKDNRAAIVPLEKIARMLMVVITIMSILAGLAMVVSSASMHAAGQMARQLSDSATVQVTATGSLTMSEQQASVVDILGWHPAVSEFRVVTNAVARKLLELWLGSAASLDGLELPRLIAVRFADDVEVYRDADTIEALSEALSQIPGVILDTHITARDGLIAMARTTQGITMFILVLLVIATATVIVFATRSSIAANREIVEVLHMIGADNRFVTRQFDRHFCLLGVLGGLFGAVIAAIVLHTALIVLPGEGASHILPTLNVNLGDVLLLYLLPPLAAILSWFAARMAVFRNLANMV